MKLADVKVNMLVWLGDFLAIVRKVKKEIIHIEIIDPRYNATEQQARRKRQVRASMLTQWTGKEPPKTR